MKIRKLLATVLGLSVFGLMLFGLAATAMYCDQVFAPSEIPTLCVENSPARMLFNTAGWLLLFVVPVVAWFVYVRFGWPRTASPFDTSSSKSNSI